jgi:hypothetical protein
VVTWGQASAGGDSGSVAKKLQDGVVHIFTTGYAFAALKEDGSIVSWGDPGRGGDSSKALAGIKDKVVGFADPFSRPASSMRLRQALPDPLPDPLIDGLPQRSTNPAQQLPFRSQTRHSQPSPPQPAPSNPLLAPAQASPFNRDLLADAQAGMAARDPGGAFRWV